MTPNAAVHITNPLSTSANAHPLDVLKIKSALGLLGHYETPDWGVSQFPDAALFAAVEKFQRDQSLKVDGILKPGGPTEQALQAALTPDQAGTALHTTAKALQTMGRNGDETLAHISPEEARLLHDITDGGSINPQTGLLEFWFGFSGNDDTKSYQSAVSKAANDESLSDDSFWSGYESASNDYFSANSDGMLNDYSGKDGGSNDGSSYVGAYQLSVNPAEAAIKVNKAKKAKAAQNLAKQARRNRAVIAPDNDPNFTSGFFDKKKDDDLDNQKDTASRYLDGLHGFDYINALVHGQNPMEKRPYPKYRDRGPRH